jgi:hypothetical protein
MNRSRYAALAAALLTLASAPPAMAQNFPLAEGEYVQMASITIDDGHFGDYADFLAGYWRAQEDFMKAQGWITSYEILSNINKRPGEPDLYLIERMKSLPDAAEIARRNEVMRAQMKLTDAQMEAASGERSKYRHVIGSALLQVLNYKK